MAKLLEVMPGEELRNVPKKPISELTADDIIPNGKDFAKLKEIFTILASRVSTSPTLHNIQYIVYIVPVDVFL